MRVSSRSKPSRQQAAENAATECCHLITSWRHSAYYLVQVIADIHNPTPILTYNTTNAFRSMVFEVLKENAPQIQWKSKMLICRFGVPVSPGYSL